ncbi:hypothetical protein DY000_02056859 [Brassica cretica]|uniref:Uncharacterized protein n=1 Tax=Brassica cretica TaxID=69181 RepID=A0ABQ7A475_BRACR|nr:hypothetical protein DY000_02056859 [Brassica cretica]
MEARLKEDGQIFDLWEHVDANSVQTPQDVYRCLEAEGFPIKYARVLITDGTNWCWHDDMPQEIILLLKSQ